MEFNYNIEGGNFSRAGTASSEVKKILKQLNVNPVISDRGPGIPDIDLAMQEGYSTASPEVREMGFGAGMGLPNMQKNCDKLTIESKVNEGTKVTMTTFF